MRAAVYYSNSDVRVEEVPRPIIGDDEVLLKVESSGICGSDVLEWYRIHRAPLILGHEVAGIIAEVGSEVADWQVGDRVVAAHHVPCNTCHYCLTGRPTVCETIRSTNFDPGGFVEYLRLPSINVDRGLFKLPDDLSFDAGTFVEPLACVLRGHRNSDIKPGESVLVLGSGISGVLHIALARALGAGLIVATDINEYRMQAAKEAGADLVVSATDDVDAAVRSANGGNKAQHVIICAGAPSAITQALDCVDLGGSILFFAPTKDEFNLPISTNDIFWRNEAKLVSSYAGSPNDHQIAMNLLAAGRIPIDSMISHQLPLDRTGEGFKMVASAGESLKIVVRPQE